MSTNWLSLIRKTSNNKINTHHSIRSDQECHCMIDDAISGGPVGVRLCPYCVGTWDTGVDKQTTSLYSGYV